VAEELANALDVVSGKLQSIDLDRVADKVGTALDQLPVAIETAVSLFEIAGKTVGFFGDVVEGVVKIFHDFTPAGFIYDHLKKTKAEETKDFSKSRDPVEVLYEGELRRKAALAHDAHSQGKYYRDPDAEFGPQEDPLTRMRKDKDRIRKELAASGKLAAQGLEGGAKDGNPKIEAAGASMGDSLKQGTAKSLDEHSPSRALFKAGAYAGEGFIDGIESQRADIESAMFTAFSAPAPTPAGGAGALGSVSVTIDLSGMNLQVPPDANASEVGDIIADKLRGMLPGALINAFDGIRAQAGS
jgi:hypothetical protein